jgi:hypothetical protein
MRTLLASCCVGVTAVSCASLLTSAPAHAWGHRHFRSSRRRNHILRLNMYESPVAKVTRPLLARVKTTSAGSARLLVSFGGLVPIPIRTLPLALLARIVPHGLQSIA